MSTIYAKAVGGREIVSRPLFAGPKWLWRYGIDILPDQWVDEGIDTPGSPALASGSPTPLVGLPGATWESTEFFADTNSARNTRHLAHFVWIRPTIIAGNDRFIVGKYDGGGPLGFRWYIRHTNSLMYAVFHTSGGTAVFTESAVSLVLNEWQHVGLVWDPDTNRAALYRNGVIVKELTSPGGSGDMQGSTVDMLIGSNSLGSNSFSGDIALFGCLDESVLPHVDEYARYLFEEERRIFGI